MNVFSRSALRRFVAATLSACLAGSSLPAQAIFADVIPLCRSAVPVTIPADTNEDIFAICTVPAKALGLNGRLRIYALMSATNNANTKTLRIRYSGIGGTAFASLIISVHLTLEVIALQIVNRGASNSQVGNGNWGVRGDGLLASANVVPITATVDTTADTTLVFTCQKAVNTDVCTLESYLVELIGGGT